MGRLIVYAGVAEPGWEHDRQAAWLAQFPGVSWYCGDDCFVRGSANRVEFRANDSSHAELWREAQPSLNLIHIASGSRIAGWGHLARFLAPMPGESGRAWIEFRDVPGLRGDHGIITTLPKLVHDNNKVEDVSGDCDDHAAESLRRLTLSRPSPAPPPPPPPQFARDDYQPKTRPEDEEVW